MIGRRLGALALLLSCVSAPAQARPDFGPDCWDRQAAEALKVQRFKTMLLVAALNCRDRQPWIMADYNAFVSANRDLLSAKLSIVRRHFIESYGPSEGLNAYSSFETDLANGFSGATFDRGRCAAMAREMRLASDVSETGLMDLVHSVPGDDRLGLCAPRPRYASRMREEWSPSAAPRDWAPAPPPPVAMPGARVAEAKPAPTPQQEWPDLAPVEAEGPARRIEPNAARSAEAAPAPAPMPENEAEPARVQVAEAAPSPASDKLQAVRDAAKALREALAALEAGEGK